MTLQSSRIHFFLCLWDIVLLIAQETQAIFQCYEKEVLLYCQGI